MQAGFPRPGDWRWFPALTATAFVVDVPAAYPKGVPQATAKRVSLTGRFALLACLQDIDALDVLRV